VLPVSLLSHDLILFKWFRPVATYPDKEGYDQELTANPYPTWQKLEEMVEKGKIRNIGLSKYVPCRLLSLIALTLDAVSIYRGWLSALLSTCQTQQDSHNGRIENLTANSLKIRPAVNQVELNFWNPQPELLKVRLVYKRAAAL
jgi:diketogulonate reductase-like aldo/keto reductase